jgi:hypothetical protein
VDKLSKTKKEVTIPWAAIIVAVTIVVLALVIVIAALTRSDQVSCSSEPCFDKQFSICHPAIWKFEDEANYPGAEGYYQVNGKVGKNCSITSYNSAVGSVKLTCDLNYKNGFSQAESDLYKNPKGFNCHKT